MIKYSGNTINKIESGGSMPGKVYYGGRVCYQGFGVAPIPKFEGKFKAIYSDGKTYTAACNSSSAITTSITKPSGYQYSLMTDAIIGDCVKTINSSAFRYFNSLKNVTIGSGLTVIDESAFYNCSALSNVTIPDSVTYIGASAFYYCSNLVNVNIPSGVTSIGNHVFFCCSNLVNVNIPSGVTVIGTMAFYSCSGLTSINIPSGVTSIGQDAFKYCAGLTSITVNAVTPPDLGVSAFNSTNDCPIYVPAESVNSYKTAYEWSNYASRIQAIQ